MDKELKNQKILKSKVKDILKELEEEKQKSLNTTDSEYTHINSLQGSHTGFNFQSIVDEKEGLILSAMCSVKIMTLTSLLPRSTKLIRS